MGARQNSDLRAERAHFVELAAVRANTIFDNVFANVFLDGKLEGLAIVGTKMLVVVLRARSHFFFFAHFCGNAGFFIGDFLREFIMHPPLDLVN